jgi:hypothetical protein
MTDLVRYDAASARTNFAPGKQQPCHICGSFAAVAEAHHVTPLAWQFERGITWENADHRYRPVDETCQ